MTENFVPCFCVHLFLLGLMHPRYEQSMNCSFIRGIVLVLLIGIVDGVSLRASTDSELGPLSSPSRPSSSHSNFWESYISSQNLFGVIVVVLMLTSVCYGFVFSGFPENNLVQLQIGWTELLTGSVPTDTIKEDNEEHAGDTETSMINAPLSVVIKPNLAAEISPAHHVLSIDDSVKLSFDYSKDVDPVRFAIDRASIASISYTVIIREGNIPVHFETLKAESFINHGSRETTEIYGSKRAYFIDINNLPQNETKLKNRILRIHYCIHK